MHCWAISVKNNFATLPPYIFIDRLIYFNLCCICRRGSIFIVGILSDKLSSNCCGCESLIWKLFIYLFIAYFKQVNNDANRKTTKWTENKISQVNIKSNIHVSHIQKGVEKAQTYVVQPLCSNLLLMNISYQKNKKLY